MYKAGSNPHHHLQVLEELPPQGVMLSTTPNYIHISPFSIIDCSEIENPLVPFLTYLQGL